MLLNNFFDRRTVLEPATTTLLLRLAELVLIFSWFSFDGRYFKHIKGVAMDNGMGPSCANLFVGFIEELIFEQHSRPEPELFGRYIDDCFGAQYVVSSSISVLCFFCGCKSSSLFFFAFFTFFLNFKTFEDIRIT